MLKTAGKNNIKCAAYTLSVIDSWYSRQPSAMTQRPKNEINCQSMYNCTHKSSGVEADLPPLTVGPNVERFSLRDRRAFLIFAFH